MQFGTLYVGAGLHPYSKACLSSWGDYGHEIVVYTYDPDLVLPRGVQRRDANEILTSDHIVLYRPDAGSGSISAFSNLFRYELVRQTDLTWVDTDVLCLRAQWPDVDYRFGWEDAAQTTCNTAVFRVPADSAVLTALCDFATSVREADLRWGMTGPRALTRVLGELGLTNLAQPHDAYYPVHHTELVLLFDPAARELVEERTRESLAVHLWDEIFRRCNVPTSLRPPEGSWLEGVLARHHVEIPITARFTDLDSLTFREPVAMVPQSDYLALEEWAHSLERALNERPDVPPAAPDRRRFKRSR